MQPVIPYRPETYPPRGPFPQFGDSQLQHTLSVTQAAHQNLAQKRQHMQEVHQDRLEYHGLMPQHYSIASDGEVEEETMEGGYASAEEEEPRAMEPAGPSMGQKALRGAAHVTKNYVYPAMRDVIVPAMGDVAGQVAVGGLTGAAWLIKKSFWSVADIIWAMNSEAGSAPDEGVLHPAIGYGGSPLGLGNGSSSSHQSNHSEYTEDWSQKPKGFLVEEIYKRPKWAQFMGRTDSRGYHTDDTGEFRKKLLKMSNKELAEVLKHLDSSS